MTKPDAKAVEAEAEVETTAQPAPVSGECPACGSGDTRQHDFRKKLCNDCGHIGFNETFGGAPIHNLDSTPQVAEPVVDPEGAGLPAAGKVPDESTLRTNAGAVTEQSVAAASHETEEKSG